MLFRSDRKGYEMLLSTAQTSHMTYEQVNTQDGIVPWGRDHNDVTKNEGEGVDWRHEKKDDLFLKGQSKRIWGEFFKVIDCSDVGMSVFAFVIHFQMLLLFFVLSHFHRPI